MMTFIANEQPTRAAVLDLPNLHLVTHALLAHKLTLLRDVACPPPQFAQLLREIGRLLAFPASAELPLNPVPVTTPLTPATGAAVAAKIAIIPILRAGLGLADGLRDIAPQAVVWHLGLKRDETTLQPIAYYNPTMPSFEQSVARHYTCLVADPMLATGGSADAALTYLKARGFADIRYIAVIAAPFGVAYLYERHPDVPLFIGALDDGLNAQGYITPGLGDAGDRQFGTI